MNKYRNTRSNYDKFPATETSGRIWRGWEEIGCEITRRTTDKRALLVLDTYNVLHDSELTEVLTRRWR